MNASVSGSNNDSIALSDLDEATRSNGAIVSEGVLAGVIAASAVAAIFLVVDLAAGHAFRTPQQLGAMLLSLFGSSTEGDMATPIALYTLFHFVARSP